MTHDTIYDKNGYARKLYPCPKCGKPRRNNYGMCRACKMADRRSGEKLAPVVTNSEVVFLTASGRRKTMYACPGCGKPRHNPRGLCLGCDQKKRQRKKDGMRCIDCGRPVSKQRVQRCQKCHEDRYRKPEVPKRLCKRCGKDIDTKAANWHCRQCNSEMAQDRFAVERGELPLDRTVLAATEETNDVRRCPTCGGKITTKSCVKCVVLGKIGAKGFV